MKKLAAVGLALAMMAGPRAPVASAEEEVADEVADLDEGDLDKIDPELLYTNTCDLDANLAIAGEREKYQPILIRFQIAISFRNALRNLAIICPQDFPAISALLLSGGPVHWLKVAMKRLWRDQVTSEGVIYENKDVMDIIEFIAARAEADCRDLKQGGDDEEGVRGCQRGLIKDMAKNFSR